MKLFSATRKVASSDFAKKMAMFVVMFMLAAIDTWASSTGAGGFTKATTEISSYQTPVANLMKAIAAVIVLVGAFNVYFKMQNGDQDVKKTIMAAVLQVSVISMIMGMVSPLMGHLPPNPIQLWKSTMWATRFSRDFRNRLNSWGFVEDS